MASPEAVAACHKRTLESAVNIYSLRSLGRGEAHGTGTDFCEVASLEDTQYGLR